MLHYRRAEGKIVGYGALIERDVTVFCQVVKVAITVHKSLTHSSISSSKHPLRTYALS